MEAKRYVPGLIIAISFCPLVLIHCEHLAGDERYQHFPLIVAAVGVLVWTRWLERRAVRTRVSVCATVICICVSVCLGVAATVLSSPWLAFVGATLYLFAFLLDWHGSGAYRFGPVVLLLLLMLPLPMRLDDALVMGLQDVSSRFASLLLDFFGVRHLLSGHIIEVPGAKFMVEEACSGVRSLFAMIALSAIFVVYERRGMLHSMSLIVSALFWSGAMNVLRIVAVVLSQLWLGVDLARGWKHDSLGLVIFIFGMVMLLCTDRVLVFLFDSGNTRRIVLTAKPPSARAVEMPLSAAWGFEWRIATSWLVALLVLTLVGVPSIGVAGIEWWEFHQDDMRLNASLLRQGVLPAQLAEWEQSTFQQGTQASDPAHGPQWAAWRYRKAGVAALVSLDFPFHSWHNLTFCYEGAGWQVKSWDVISVAGEGQKASVNAIRFRIEKRQAENGVVYFNLFDTTGKLLPAPGNRNPAFSDWLTGLKLRMARRTSQMGFGRANYQLQVMASGTPEDLKRVEKDLQLLFLAAYAKLAGQLSGSQ